jgi:hypothetical protein
MKADASIQQTSSTILRAFLMCALVIALAAPAAWGAPEQQGTVFRRPINSALAYFEPLAAEVTAAADGVATLGAGSAAGIKRGMRIRVFRKGRAYVHPVTGQAVGQTETPVGVVEVTEVSDGESSARVIAGRAEAGDMVRISSAPVKALFFQASDVDWNVSEEYYFWLKDSGRFELIDSPPGQSTDEDVVGLARSLGAEVAVVLNSVGAEGRTVLRQRLLWATDGAAFDTQDIFVPEGSVQQMQVAEAYFEPETTPDLYAIELEGLFHLIASADLNGDGRPEVIMATGSDLRIMDVGVTLKPAMGAEEIQVIKGDVSELPIRLETADLDADGRDEILVVTNNSNRIRSYIHTYDPETRRFCVLWEGKVFARIMDGGLVGQDYYGVDGGYKGPVFRMGWEPGAEGYTKGELLALPEGVDIYDFTFTKGAGGQTYTLVRAENEYLDVYDAAGVSLWRTQETYGGSVQIFDRRVSLPSGDLETWEVPDRFVHRGNGVFTIKRERTSGVVKGLGYKSSMIMGLYGGAPPLSEAPVATGVPDKARDFAFDGTRLIVLTETYTVNIMNLFRGQKVYTSKLLIYAQKARQ